MNDGLVIERIKERIPKARNKHAKPSYEALLSEVGELADAIIKMREAKEIPKKYHKNHIESEAIDVAVVAIRIACGELY